MDVITALTLGFIQGFTEFLPISSSGHLVLARAWFGLSFENGLAYDAVLHIATACAVLVYFWRDWLRLAQAAVLILIDYTRVSASDRTMIGGLLIASIPVIAVGLLFESYIETVLYSAHAVAWTMLLSAVLFVGAEWYVRTRTMKELTHVRALGVGLFQTLALLPGMSRSGATIAGGMMVGLSRVDASRFSFMVSLPIVLGAGGMKLLSFGVAGLSGMHTITLILGLLVAFLMGVTTIHYFLSYVRHYSLVPFAVYLVIVSLLTFVCV